MDVQNSPVEADIVEEGDLSPSLEDLAGPPRLRGELGLKAGQLTGWLLDAHAPNSRLGLSLTLNGQKATATVAPRYARGENPSRYLPI